MDSKGVLEAHDFLKVIKGTNSFSEHFGDVEILFSELQLLVYFERETNRQLVYYDEVLVALGKFVILPSIERGFIPLDTPIF